jgi:hypothetical protein
VPAEHRHRVLAIRCGIFGSDAVLKGCSTTLAIWSYSSAILTIAALTSQLQT